MHFFKIKPVYGSRHSRRLQKQAPPTAQSLVRPTSAHHRSAARPHRGQTSPCSPSSHVWPVAVCAQSQLEPGRRPDPSQPRGVSSQGGPPAQAPPIRSLFTGGPWSRRFLVTSAETSLLGLEDPSPLPLSLQYWSIPGLPSAFLRQWDDPHTCAVTPNSPGPVLSGEVGGKSPALSHHSKGQSLALTSVE